MRSDRFHKLVVDSQSMACFTDVSNHLQLEGYSKIGTILRQKCMQNVINSYRVSHFYQSKKVPEPRYCTGARNLTDIEA